MKAHLLAAEHETSRPELAPGVLVTDRAAHPAHVSVIVPLIERPDSLPELYAEYASALRGSGYRFDFVFAGGPEHRAALDSMLSLRAAGEPVQVVEGAQAAGEAALLRLALPQTTGDWIVTLAPRRRIAAAGLPQLVAWAEAGAEVVVARRAPDQDPWVNRVQRALLHRLLAWSVGGDFHDLGSGVRVLRRNVLGELPIYGELCRYLPLLGQREGFRVEECLVPQHPLDQRARLFGPGTYFRRLLDLVGVAFLVRFRERPLRFFGLIGGLATLLGSLLLAILFIQRLGGRDLGDRPIVLLAVLLAVLGVQAIALGLIGEIIVHGKHGGALHYRVAERIEHGPKDPGDGSR
jgi:hypothetical protein